MFHVVKRANMDEIFLWLPNCFRLLCRLQLEYETFSNFSLNWKSEKQDVDTDKLIKGLVYFKHSLFL